MNRHVRSKLCQIQFCCAGALVALGGAKYLIDMATETENRSALYGALASVTLLLFFVLHLRDITRSL